MAIRTPFGTISLPQPQAAPQPAPTPTSTGGRQLQIGVVQGPRQNLVSTPQGSFSEPAPTGVGTFTGPRQNIITTPTSTTFEVPSGATTTFPLTQAVTVNTPSGVSVQPPAATFGADGHVQGLGGDGSFPGLDPFRRMREPLFLNEEDGSGAASGKSSGLFGLSSGATLGLAAAAVLGFAFLRSKGAA